MRKFVSVFCLGLAFAACTTRNGFSRKVVKASCQFQEKCALAAFNEQYDDLNDCIAEEYDEDDGEDFVDECDDYDRNDATECIQEIKDATSRCDAEDYVKALVTDCTFNDVCD